jgi:DNA-binding GntR family transcriptional regulator
LIERPRSLSDVVLERLRDLIVSGYLPLGSPISERRLAEHLQVSKTPVREALAQLKAEGLVTIVAHKPARVFTLSAREIAQMCEFRETLEMKALHLALERDGQAFADDVSEIVAAMTKARKAGDTRAYLALDTAFHAAFFQHCGNHYLRNSYERYVGKIAALRTHLAGKPLHTQRSYEEHVQLRDLIRRGAVEEAKRILVEHIERTRRSYAEGVEDVAAADSARDAG